MTKRWRFLMPRILLALAILISVAAVVGYFSLRHPPRVQMERYVPASALAYIEISSLGELLDRFTDTRAWQELAPAFGMSSQLNQLGRVADVIGRTGLGPDELVIAGRGQFALVLTDLDAESGATEQGAYVHLKPRLALVIETHSEPDVARRLVTDRAGMVAQRIYGSEVREERQQYAGTELLVFRGQTPDRQLVAAASHSTMLIANHDSAIKSCLDSVAGRTASLAGDETLKQNRALVDQGASLLAYVTARGCQQLAQLGPALFASRFTTDPERIQAVAGLFGHLSKQTLSGLLYGAEFNGVGLTDRYLTVLTPEVAAEVSMTLEPGADRELGSLRLVPRNVADFTVLNIQRVGELPETTLKRLSPRLDVVGGLALREFVLNLRRRLGLEPSDSLGGATGSELTLVRFDDAEPIAMLIEVADRAQLLAPLARYLKASNSAVETRDYKGVEIAVSSHEDGRAAAFVDGYLVLATESQLERIIDANQGDGTLAADGRARVAREVPARAAVISCRPSADDAAAMMLALSELTRATDGSREILKSEPIRQALERLPATVSFTEVRAPGVYTETRSAVGNFGLIGSLLKNAEPE